MTATSLKLYEINQLYNDTLEAVIESDETDLSIMDELETEFNDKAIATASFFENMESEIAAIKEAETKMKARRTAMENKVKRLKDYLLRNMLETGITKISCPYFEIKTKNNPVSVAVKDERIIPDDFVTVKTTKSPDKKRIKEAIQNGETVPGCELVQGKSLIIK